MSFGILTTCVVALSVIGCAATCFEIHHSDTITADGRFLSILPQNWKQWACCVAIISTMFGTFCMYYFYYHISALDVVKREIVLTLLWPMTLSDIKQMRIPNKLLLAGLATRAILIPIEFIYSSEDALISLKSAGIAAVFALIVTIGCALISKGSLGMGDIKLFCLLGLFLGTVGLFYASFLSILIAFFAAIGLLLFKKKKRKDAIPFAPFILAGTILSFILSGT